MIDMPSGSAAQPEPNQDTQAMTVSTWPWNSGDMAARICGHNWAATSLGPTKGWPQSLKALVDLMLATSQIATLAVGPERIFLYNDEASRHYGDRHPEVLGWPLATAFPHEFGKVAPFYDRVFAGDVVHVPAQPLDPARTGLVEVFDAHLAPVRDSDGRVIAAYMTGSAIGERQKAEARLRESEKRQAFLLELTDELSRLLDPDEIMHAMSIRLGQRLGLATCFFADVNEAQEHVTVHQGWNADGVISLKQTFRLQDYLTEEFQQKGRTGAVTIVNDTATDPRTTSANFASLAVGAFIAIPFHREGRWTAYLGATDSKSRDWTADEIALFHDISDRVFPRIERARAEAALRESEERHRSLFETISQGFSLAEVVRDVAGKAVDWLLLEMNPVFEDYAGMTVAECVGRTATDVFGSADPHWLAVYDRVVTNRKAERSEAWFGPINRWVGVDVYPATGDKFSVLYEDISERKRAEIALRESEERQAFLLKLSDALRLLSDPEAILAQALRVLGEHLKVNRALFAERDGDEFVVTRDFVNGVPSMVGRYSKEAFGQYTSEVYNQPGRVVIYDVPGDPTLSDQEKAQFRAAHIASYAGAVLHKEGGISIVLVVHHNVPRNWTDTDFELIEETAERTWAAVERARVEASLRDSEERLRQFGEASQDILWIRDATTLQWTYLTPAFEAVYGLSREEALSGDNWRNWEDLIVDEDREHAVASILRVRNGEKVNFEYRIKRPIDGEMRWLRNTDFPMRDEAGRVVAVGGVGSDNTRLKEIEAEVEASEGRLRILMEGIPQLVWRSCDKGLWTWCSPQWMAFTGQNQTESHALGWLDVVYPDDRATAMQAWDDAQPHGKLDVEYRVRRAADGAWLWHRTRSVPVRNPAGSDGTEGVIAEWLGTTTDIDGLKRLQGEQQVLVAELQHRTRNLLAVVRNVARRSIGPSPERDEYDARLGALGRVQGFLSRSAGYLVPLADLVEAELHAAGNGASGKVAIAGLAVNLPGESVQVVALALHELATNAVKYGAIAQLAAQLSVTWCIEAGSDGAPRLVIDWRESGVVMPPGPPARRGYGSELITRALPYQLGAETALEFTSDGVRCRIILPASAFNSRTETELVQ